MGEISMSESEWMRVYIMRVMSVTDIICFVTDTMVFE